MHYKQKKKQGKLKMVRVSGIVTLLIIAYSFSTINAQSIYVKQINDTQTEIDLGRVSKMTFSLGNLTVTKNDNSTDVFTISELRYLSFEDYTNNESSIDYEISTMLVYPNPLRDVLNIELSNKGTVQIISLEGKVLHNMQVYSDGILTLPTDKLPKGVYVCQYSNDKEIKTVKILKQ